MGCEICGRGACTRSFHSLEAQKEYDETHNTDEVKSRVRDIATRKLNRLKCEYIDDVCYIKLDDAIEAVDDATY